MAAFSIVAAHTAGGAADSQVPLGGPWWFCITLYFCLGYWAIPVFVMISGALLLDAQRQESAWAFYRRRLHRLALPIFFWTVFYLGLRVWRDHEALGPQQIMTSILQGRPYAHLWFLYMIPGLYLITPALSRFVRMTTTRQRIVVIVAILVVADTYHLANVMFWGIPNSIFSMFLPFISYYLLGHELFVHRPKFSAKLLLGAFLVSFVYLALLARPFISLKGQQYHTFLLSFFGPPAALTAILVFTHAARHDRNGVRLNRFDRCLRWLSPLTLGIYVMHVAILETLRDMAGHGHAHDHLITGLIAGPVIAFTLSGMITALIQKIPYLRHIVG